jgi:hypothetical protein
MAIPCCGEGAGSPRPVEDAADEIESDIIEDDIEVPIG